MSPQPAYHRATDFEPLFYSQSERWPILDFYPQTKLKALQRALSQYIDIVGTEILEFYQRYP
jgi:hypothetical protein